MHARTRSQYSNIKTLKFTLICQKALDFIYFLLTHFTYIVLCDDARRKQLLAFLEVGGSHSWVVAAVALFFVDVLMIFVFLLLLIVACSAGFRAAKSLPLVVASFDWWCCCDEASCGCVAATFAVVELIRS